MDKYEYKLKTEQMLELMNDGAYKKAAEVADSIDWNRVRNTSMLSTVSEIYEKSREYQKSYEVLRIAYNRAEGSRKIISRLCTLALKTRNIDEAIDYYDDFIETAPKDPNQYILKYQILRAQRAPIEQQIHALEEFKKAEYIEEWAYELAKLYQEAGMTAECLEECDDLILWFSEGKYVFQAMELKMQYKPLTPSQQEKYDHRYEKLSSETEEIPDLVQYQQKKAEGTESSDNTPAEVEHTEHAESDIEEDEPVQALPKKKVGNTMKLDEALKSLLNIKIKTDEPEEVSQKTEDLTELESKIEEIESIADLGLAEKVAEEKRKEDIMVDPDLEELRPEPEESAEGEASVELEDAIEAEVSVEIEAPAEPEVSVRAAEDGDQIQGQMSFKDFLGDWGEPEVLEEESLEVEEAEALDEEVLEVEEAEALDEEVLEAEEAEDLDEEVLEIEKAEALDEEILEAEETEKGEVQLEAVEVEEETTATEAVDAVSEKGGAMEDKRKESTPILSPDIQRLIDEIEGNIPPQEEAEKVPGEEILEEAVQEEPVENKANTTEELRVEEDSEEFEDYDDLLDEEEYEEETDGFEWGEEDAEDLIPDLEGYEEALSEDYAEELQDADEAEDVYEEDYEDDPLSVAEGFEEEFRLQKHDGEVDDREIPDEDEEIDLLSATTPLSRKETAKLIATGKTAPLPMGEISDALSMSDTGFVVHGRYDLKMQSGIGTRAGLTEEQKKLFSYFVPVRGMSEQLVDVLEQDKNCTNRQGTSCTGNLLIIGNKGNGKTVLAVDVVKAIQKQRQIRQGKVAIVTGDSLNKKKISDIISKLYGGALIIEKAGKMNEKTVARLNKAMEHDTGELLLVLEDQRKPLDRLLSSNREFRRKFTSRLEVPVFINDELVTFGQTYAQENGYRIDEMSILALYSRIDSLQREDHAVTIAEVKEIMDEAMAHSQKASAKKLVKRVFGKNTDDSDRIILTEKDFNI